jgi:hypothetical protein
MITNLAKFTAEIGSPVRILVILAIVIALHLVVIGVRRLSRQVMSLKTPLASFFMSSAYPLQPTWRALPYWVWLSGLDRRALCRMW